MFWVIDVFEIGDWLNFEVCLVNVFIVRCCCDIDVDLVFIDIFFGDF